MKCYDLHMQQNNTYVVSLKSILYVLSIDIYTFDIS